MKFVPAKCPSCNGELQVPDDRDFIKCMYCGIDIKVRDVVQVASNYSTEIKFWRLDAEKAFQKEEYGKAIDIYDKILIIKPNDYDVNINKGKAILLLLKQNYHLRTKNIVDIFEEVYVKLNKETKDFSNFFFGASYKNIKEHYELDNKYNLECHKSIDNSLECFSNLISNNNGKFEQDIADFIVNLIDDTRTKINMRTYAYYPHKWYPHEKDVLDDFAFKFLANIAAKIGFLEKYLNLVNNVSIINKIKDLCKLALSGGNYISWKKKIFFYILVGYRTDKIHSYA